MDEREQREMALSLVRLVREIAARRVVGGESVRPPVLVELRGVEDATFYLQLEVDGNPCELRIARDALPNEPRDLQSRSLQQARGMNGKPARVIPNPADRVRERILQALNGFSDRGFNAAYVNAQGVFPDRTMTRQQALDAAKPHRNGSQYATGRRADDERKYVAVRSASGEESVQAWKPSGEWTLVLDEPLGVDWVPDDHTVMQSLEG